MNEKDKFTELCPLTETDLAVRELSKEVDKEIEKLLHERYPGVAIQEFTSTFLPGKDGFRLIAPDGKVFDFEYVTHGPETADDGSTTMTREVVVTEHSPEWVAGWDRYGRTRQRPMTIAVDFDGTLCENKWPEIGEEKWGTLRWCQEARAGGARLILWTNRVGQRLHEAVEWCGEHGLAFDAVNENLPEVIELFGGDTRKIVADLYIDDKAVRADQLELIMRGLTPHE